MFPSRCSNSSACMLMFSMNDARLVPCQWNDDGSYGLNRLTVRFFLKDDIPQSKPIQACLFGILTYEAIGLRATVALRAKI